MASVSSYSELAKRLKDVRNKALEGAAEKTVKLGKEIIDDVVYGSDSPESYERTYQLRDSLRDNPIESVFSNKATIKIDHDKARISPNVASFQHASTWWSPWDYSGYVAKTVHDGLSGGLFGEGYWRGSRPYMDNTEKELKAGKYRKFMVDEIRAMGFKVR